jgi:hypothetical protein
MVATGSLDEDEEAVVAAMVVDFVFGRRIGLGRNARDEEFAVI